MERNNLLPKLSLVPTLLVLALMIVALSACPAQKSTSTDYWHRGNTHVHTTISDGDSTPEQVVRWYAQRGYDFLVLTDHNSFLDPNELSLSREIRQKILVLGGEELSLNLENANKKKLFVHTTAMAIEKLIDWRASGKSTSDFVQAHVDRIVRANGVAILNHPNMGYSISANDILEVKDLSHFEVFNAHPFVSNEGDEQHPSVEQMWDKLLSEGMKIFGVASDDAHSFKGAGDSSLSRPGEGWIMVRSGSEKPTVEGIKDAIQRGDFYASTGVFLERYVRDGGLVKIKVDDRATSLELSRIWRESSRNKSSSQHAEEGIEILFVGPEGKVVQATGGHEASFSVDDHKNIDFVRAKVILTIRNPRDLQLEQYFAWLQPIFIYDKNATSSN